MKVDTYSHLECYSIIASYSKCTNSTIYKKKINISTTQIPQKSLFSESTKLSATRMFGAIYIYTPYIYTALQHVEQATYIEQRVVISCMWYVRIIYSTTACRASYIPI